MEHPSSLPDTLLSAFAGARLHAMYFYSFPLGNGSPRKQKKLRHYITSTVLKQRDDIPDTLRKSLYACTDAEFSEYFDRCVEVCKQREETRDAQWKQLLSAFDEGVQNAFLKCKQLVLFPPVQKDGADAILQIDDSIGYIRTLRLCQVDGVPEEKEPLFLNELQLRYESDTGTYCLYGKLEHPENPAPFPFSVTFRSAQVEVVSYNAFAGACFWDTPWDYLLEIAFAIGCKAELPGDFCNTAEKALLPLLREIVMLEYWMESPDSDGTAQSFDHMKALARKHSAEKVNRLLEQLEKALPGSPAYTALTRKLLALLSREAYKPLWREVYAALVRSQENYPSKAEAFCPAELLQSTRQAIQKTLQAKGYDGEYPDFLKEAYLPGPRLVTAYRRTYLVGTHRSHHYIHCTESYEESDRQLTVQFLCGTALLKKGDDTEDVYDCIFDAKGRQIFRLLHHQTAPQGDTDAPERRSDLTTDLAIAVKKAECRKLTKAEKQTYSGNDRHGFFRLQIR